MIDADLLTPAPAASDVGHWSELTPSLAAMPDLIRTLDAMRSSMPRAAWVHFCQQDEWLKAWREFAAADPLTRHALTKPRGYPGDAVLMDFIYRHPSVAKPLHEAPPDGRAISRLIASYRLTVSAIRRLDVIGHYIRTMLEQRGAITIASFAAGHARELEELDDATCAAITAFHAIDSDPLSLREIEASQASRIAVRPVERNILRLRSGEAGSNDLVYSSGLFDYLNDRAAQRVVAAMAECVKPGGRLLIGNLAEDAANLGYVEAMLDWWMIPRSRAQIEALGAPLKRDHWDVQVMRVGCFLYLVANRRGITGSAHGVGAAP